MEITPEIINNHGIKTEEYKKIILMMDLGLEGVNVEENPEEAVEKSEPERIEIPQDIIDNLPKVDTVIESVEETEEESVEETEETAEEFKEDSEESTENSKDADDS